MDLQDIYLYTKHRHEQLQSQYSAFLHNLFTHSLALKETGRNFVSQWMSVQREEWWRGDEDQQPVK